MKSLLFSLVTLCLTSALAHPQDSDSIIRLPVNSKIIFKSEFHVRPRSHQTLIGDVRGRECWFYTADISPNERIIASGTEMHVNSVTEKSNYQYQRMIFLNEEKSIALVCMMYHTIRDLKKILSSRDIELIFPQVALDPVSGR